MPTAQTLPERAPWWLRGGHAQTIWASQGAQVCSAQPQAAWQRERWATPDGDFLDVDRLPASAPSRPLVVLFHGLEGSRQSHYARAFAAWASAQDLNLALPHFRGCSGELNLAPRAYHSGDHQEIHWILQRLRAAHRAEGGQQLVAAGVSLGGNALMVWAGEQGASAAQLADAVASISSPLDLTASGHQIGRGLNRWIYTPYFLRSMVPKALAKLRQHPGLFDEQALRRARTLEDFDNVFTAPLHGFADTADYWRRASALPRLAGLRIPALLLNARNDPFIPADSLPGAQQVSSSVRLWQPAEGGHVGFVAGAFPGDLGILPQTVGAWLLKPS